MVGLLAGCGGTSRTGSWASGFSVDRADTDYRVGALSSAFESIGTRDNDLAAVHPDGTVVQINASCEPSDDVPLNALTQHLLFGFTDRQRLGEEQRVVNGREALLSHYTARLDGVRRSLLLVVIKKDGCVYDFALIAPNEDVLDSHRAEFVSMIDALETAPRLETRPRSRG